MRKLLVFLSLLTASPWLLASACRAETITVCEAASSDDYLTKTSGQFLRGTANLSLCWLEMIHQPVIEVRGGNNLFVGLFKGVGHTLLRAAEGVGELVTFPVPQQDKDGSFPHIANDCAFGIAGLENH